MSSVFLDLYSQMLPLLACAARAQVSCKASVSIEVSVAPAQILRGDEVSMEVSPPLSSFFSCHVAARHYFARAFARSLDLSYTTSPPPPQVCIENASTDGPTGSPVAVEVRPNTFDLVLARALQDAAVGLSEVLHTVGAAWAPGDGVEASFALTADPSIAGCDDTSHAGHPCAQITLHEVVRLGGTANNSVCLGTVSTRANCGTEACLGTALGAFVVSVAGSNVVTVVDPGCIAAGALTASATGTSSPAFLLHSPPSKPPAAPPSTPAPTAEPTATPTAKPTATPTDAPSSSPTQSPTQSQCSLLGCDEPQLFCPDCVPNDDSRLLLKRALEKLGTCI